MIDPDPHIRAYKDVLEKYVRLASLLEHLLSFRIRESGIRHPVTARAKDVGSFAKKAVRKGYVNPLEDMTDLAAARIMVANLVQAKVAKQVVWDVLTVEDDVGISKRHKPYEMGYLGANYVGRIKAELIPASASDLVDLRCEVQIHTRAQNLWSDMAHPFLYKPDIQPPAEVQRELYGLSVFVETFDTVLERALGVIYNSPGYQEATMLRSLDKMYYQFADTSYDDQLTLQVLGALKALYTPGELNNFGMLIGQFVGSESEKLSYLFSHGQTDELCTPFLFQPESLVVFERLEHDPDTLETAWSSVMPLGVLEDLRIMWGTKFG